ncbi:MAG: DRTGG domain-containing protein [Acutalibacteraceae bacterium]|nr:DRTGG domain-containing protein [Acutalibacteraceae bacterium]
MTVQNLIDEFSLEVLCCGDKAAEKEVKGGYCGDMLIWVMSRANEGDCWLTVMGNVNSIGVAVLADVACILLTENSAFDDDAKMRAEQNGVIVLRSGENAFDLAVKIAEKL